MYQFKIIIEYLKTIWNAIITSKPKMYKLVHYDHPINKPYIANINNSIIGFSIDEETGKEIEHYICPYDEDHCIIGDKVICVKGINESNIDWTRHDIEYIIEWSEEDIFETGDILPAGFNKIFCCDKERRTLGDLNGCASTFGYHISDLNVDCPESKFKFHIKWCRGQYSYPVIKTGIMEVSYPEARYYSINSITGMMMMLFPKKGTDHYYTLRLIKIEKCSVTVLFKDLIYLVNDYNEEVLMNVDTLIISLTNSPEYWQLERHPKSLLSICQGKVKDLELDISKVPSDALEPKVIS